MARKNKEKDFYDKLRDKMNNAKSASTEFSRLAKEKGPHIGKQIGTESKQRWEKGVLMARKATSSHEKIFDLIEKLGTLKEKGLITHEEFDTKKKELLDRL